jgi:hypothetical protein
MGHAMPRSAHRDDGLKWPNWRPAIRRAYILSVIDQVEVDDEEIRTSVHERP